MTAWKRTLAVVWLSQFFSIMGFSFAMPFAAYYLQDLGVPAGKELKLWVSVFAAATPFTLAIFSPIWGHLSDRFGRRLMMLRAYAGGAVVLMLMGLVEHAWQLIGLRMLQGVFTGTVLAAQTMISVSAPRERSGTALGILSTSVFSGGMAGGAIGGIVADVLGYRASFFFSSAFLLLALLLTVFGTRESAGTGVLPHEPLQIDEPKPTARSLVRGTLPILLLILLMAGVRQFDAAFVPLLVQELNGGRTAGASIYSGILLAVGAAAGMMAGFYLGRLADRRNPPAIAKVCALAAAVTVLPQVIVSSFAGLAAARFGLAFFAGGLDPVFLIWLAKVTPGERRGAIFGWAGTAKSVGWVVAPLVGGIIAAHFGIRAIFLVEAMLFLVLIPCISLAVRKIGGK